jgi:hypothetical protein
VRYHVASLNGRSRTRFRKALVAVAVLAVLGCAYLLIFGLPPYPSNSSVYPGHPPLGLDVKIHALMSELCVTYPDPAMKKKVDRIYSGWRMPPDQRLAALGPGAVPYVAQKMNAKTVTGRVAACEMFDYLARHVLRARPGTTAQDFEPRRHFILKYVNPVWQCATYDESPRVRLFAARCAVPTDDTTPSLQRMLRDPDAEVRIAAGKNLAGSHRGFVPLCLRYRKDH